MREPGVQRGSDYSRRHLRTGWWSLLLFAAMGLALESLHGFKIRTYLDVSNETRRLMWTLAHAHGTLLALVNVVFGLTLRSGLEIKARDLQLVSLCFLGASALLPAGFLLGGLVVHGGDPGLGVLLVPLGAALLLWALFCVARATMAP
ncbi:MAG TPA: hypothetical protein VGY48_33495 [Vicinamibacterales bacterium]|jgi:hypothetical protein|nr:hypothetical protein [Vicinamibacterales bacterium]